MTASDIQVGNDSTMESSIGEWTRILGLSNKTVLTTTETAKVLRISERLLRDEIKEGRIPSIRFGRRVLIPVPLLVMFLLRDASTQAGDNNV